ncbi:hypothetical protein PUN28_007433 [Cardiocondyla obscurior]|uniref:Uncharacterized protein n=1 Tax=Cardiocondyla obscurior TaxID=286306 RepID=A0AAW2G9I2_9HYME
MATECDEIRLNFMGLENRACVARHRARSIETPVDTGNGNVLEEMNVRGPEDYAPVTGRRRGPITRSIM